MSAKNNDPKGRYRSETIAYRCSPAERKELDKRWKLMGYLTKQDYVLDAVLHNKVTAKGNPQMLVNFRKELYYIISELERINEASMVENMLVMMINMVVLCAFLVIIFGAFSGISDKWGMRQTAREYMLIMETEGYLTPADRANLISELEGYGLYNISLSGTTMSEVDYGNRIYLKISGTYNENVLSFAGGLSKVADHPVRITINRQTTAKQ